MTLLIKVAGGRESDMVHLGEGISFPNDRDINTPRSSTSSRSDRSRGGSGWMQLLTDDVCIELLMWGSPGIFAQAFGLGATSWRIDGTRCAIDANGHFRRQGRIPFLNATLR
jgi:hypothetical protein